MGGGEFLGRYHPWQVTPLDRYTPGRYIPLWPGTPSGAGTAQAGTPPRQVHPLGRYTPSPWQVHPLPLAGTPALAGTAPRAGTPPGQVPPGRYTPLGKYTPWAGTPPWAGTSPDSYTPLSRSPGQVPLWAGTPPGRYTPPKQVHPRERYTTRGRYTPSHGQWAGGTHPTGMHSCWS